MYDYYSDYDDDDGDGDGRCDLTGHRDDPYEGNTVLGINSTGDGYSEQFVQPRSPDGSYYRDGDVIDTSTPIRTYTFFDK